MKAFRNFLLIVIVVLVAGQAFHYGNHKSIGFFIWSVHKDPDSGERSLVRTADLPAPNTLAQADNPAAGGSENPPAGDDPATTTTGNGDQGTAQSPDSSQQTGPGDSSTSEPEPEPEPEPQRDFVLFDGKDLGKWQPIQFGGEGETIVNEDGYLEFGFGAIMTGVNWSEDPPATSNYQIDLDAMKLDGNDFFCGLTFPVKDNHATLIIGGWGGGVVGISSVDDLDASENETMNIEGFENDVWYHVRVRVTDEKIEAWIDDRQMVDLELKDRKISLRPGDIELCVPLGIASFVTRAQYRKIEWKNLTEAEIKAGPEPFKKPEAPEADAETPEPTPAEPAVPDRDTEAGAPKEDAGADADGQN